VATKSGSLEDGVEMSKAKGELLIIKEVQDKREEEKKRRGQMLGLMIDALVICSNKS
jgi:hypothetical protein